MVHSHPDVSKEINVVRRQVQFLFDIYRSSVAGREIPDIDLFGNFLTASTANEFFLLYFRPAKNEFIINV